MCSKVTVYRVAGWLDCIRIRRSSDGPGDPWVGCVGGRCDGGSAVFGEKLI